MHSRDKKEILNKKVTEILEKIPLIEEKILKVCEDNEISSQLLIQELVRFLDMVHDTNQHLSPSYLVDLAWHEFILFTRFYDEFCKKHYNRFIHHTPSKESKPTIFFKTIQLYIKQYGQPHPKIWGEVAQEEWKTSNCGSCLN